MEPEAQTELSPTETPTETPAPVPEPAPSLAFTDPAQEASFTFADKLFVDPPRVQQKTRTLLVTLAMFAGISLLRDGSAIDMAVLVGVLFVHELGHALAMVLLGYTDVRVFFIPLLGAAASGRKRGLARWKEGVVL